MIPVRHPGQDDLFEILPDPVHRFALLRPVGWQGFDDVVRLHRVQHRQAPGIVQIIRHPVDQPVAPRAKFFHELPDSLSLRRRPRPKPGHKLLHRCLRFVRQRH